MPKVALIIMAIGLALIAGSKIVDMVIKKEKYLYSSGVVAGCVLGIIIAILFLCGVGEKNTVLMAVLCSLFIAACLLYIVLEILYIVKTIKKIKNNNTVSQEISQTVDIADDKNAVTGVSQSNNQQK